MTTISGSARTEQDGDASSELLRSQIEIHHDALNFSGTQILTINVVQNIKKADEGPKFE